MADIHYHRREVDQRRPLNAWSGNNQQYAMPSCSDRVDMTAMNPHAYSMPNIRNDERSFRTCSDDMEMASMNPLPSAYPNPGFDNYQQGMTVSGSYRGMEAIASMNSHSSRFPHFGNNHGDMRSVVSPEGGVVIASLNPYPSQDPHFGNNQQGMTVYGPPQGVETIASMNSHSSLVPYSGNNYRNMRTSGPSPGLVAFSSVNAPAGDAISPAEALRYHDEIVRRLRWRLPYLAVSLHRARDQAVARAATSGSVEVVNDLFTAHIMFKLDFCEYHMLLERALVYLMDVFGITVLGRPVTARAAVGSGHSYHWNVLTTLEDRNNPLHQCLGRGQAWRNLNIVRQLRNQWKLADRDGEYGSLWLAEAPDATSLNIKAQVAKLRKMMNAILDGIETGRDIAVAHLRSCRR